MLKLTVSCKKLQKIGQKVHFDKNAYSILYNNSKVYDIEKR